MASWTDLSDFAAMIAASHLPISIVIVGVGEADFSDMAPLLNSNIRIKGDAAIRDITNFVLYQPDIRAEIFGKEAFSKLPFQLVTFFRLQNIRPNP